MGKQERKNMRKLRTGQVIRVFFGDRWRSTRVELLCGDTLFANVAGAVRCFKVDSPLVERSSPVEALIGMRVR